MALIFETKNFIVNSRGHPHICRTDGGHIVIAPKKPVVNRWDLDTKRATELMLLSMIVGEAMTKALNKRGIPVERINFQDNGNWALGTKEGSKFHLHLYGRARNSKNQRHGQSTYFPDKETKFYMELEPLSEDDIKEILKQVRIIYKKPKYRNKIEGIKL